VKQAKELADKLEDAQKDLGKGKLPGPTASAWITRARRIATPLGC
jgi:hypothetical protein